MIAFSPALSAGWTNWDDPAMVLNDPTRFGLDQLAWMWTEQHMGHYAPLSWMTFAFDRAIWGLESVGWHLTSLLFHTTSGVLLFFVLRAFVPAAQALVGALFFALHPLRVESVLWISDRMDVVSMTFALAALLAWLRFRERGGAWFFAAVGLYAASLCAKANAVTFPLVLLVLDAWFARQDWKQAALEKLPFFGLAGLFAGLAVWAKADWGGLVGGHLGGVDRLEMALYGAAFYPGKLLLPFGLSPLYEWDGAALGTWRNLLVVGGITTLVVVLRKRARGPLYAWGLYLLLLLPVSGLFQAGPQLVADRYSYFACIPLIALAATLFRSHLGGALGGVIACGLAILTYEQSKVWDGSVDLWTHALELDPDNEIVMAQLGWGYLDVGRPQEAAAVLEEALTIGPARPQTILMLGVAYAQSGRVEKARHAWSQVPPDAAEYAQAQAWLAEL